MESWKVEVVAVSGFVGHDIIMCVNIIVVEVRSNPLCSFRQTVVYDGFGEHQDVAGASSNRNRTREFQTTVVPPSKVEVAFVRAR